MRFTTLLLGVALFASIAQADTLYAISGASGHESSLYVLDKTTGAVISTIGATGFSHVSGISFQPGTGVLYGSVGAHAGNGYREQLITIDLTTGVGTVVGETGFRLPDLAFASDGTLYGWAQIPGNTYPVGLDGIVSIDLGTGAATLVGATEYYTAVPGFAIDSTDRAWMKTTQFPGGPIDQIWSIDLATGLTIPPFDPSGFGVRNLTDADTGAFGLVVHNMLAFDENDVLYSGKRSGGGFTLYSIDLGVAHAGSPNAMATALGSNDIGYISGIAFLADNPVPEPGSVFLVAVALGGVVMFRRRRRQAS